MNKTLAMLLCLGALAGCSSGETDKLVGETASDRIDIAAESDEPIVSIAVREGQQLTAGQEILRQDAARANTRLEGAAAVVGRVAARLNELRRGPRSEIIEQARANLSGAERELTFRRAELKRVAALQARQLASPDALDAAQAAFDTAVANVRLRRAELEEQLAGTTIEELEQAEQSLAEAEARRDAARIDVERHTLRAPVDGVADTRLFEVGERPRPGQPVFVMLSGTQPHVRVYIPERLRANVSPGTAATIHVDGFDEPLAGRVRWVSNEAAFTPYFALTERDRGNLSYLAKIDIVAEIERLPDGVPVEVIFGEERSQ